MNPADLLKAAADRGLTLRINGGKLRVLPGSLLSPDFAEVLKAHKTALMALLKDAANTRTSGKNPSRCDSQCVPGAPGQVEGVLTGVRARFVTRSCKTCGRPCAKGEPLAEYCSPTCWQKSLLAPTNDCPQRDRIQYRARAAGFYEARRRSDYADGPFTGVLAS